MLGCRPGAAGTERAADAVLERVEISRMAATSADLELLFTEFQLGPLRLKNRVVGLPHASAHVRDGVPTEDDLAYWEARAAGGAALFINGGTKWHPSSVMRGRILTEAWSPDALAALARRTAAVHARGASIVCQLVHLGREGIGSDSEYASVAPSALRSVRTPSVPHALSRAEIDELIESFATCAEGLRGAGYDGVEVHAAHGYLVAQFLSAAANRREDEYGGDLAGRMHFLERIVAGVRELSGPDFVVGVRLSAEEEIPGGMRLDDALAVTRRLSEVARPDYLSITMGTRGSYVKDVTEPLGVAVPAAAAIKAATTLPVLVGGRIVDPRMAEDILRQGAADLVGLARALIVDPDWVRKAAAGEVRSIRPCIGVNQECRTFPGGILCAASARTGRERLFAAEAGRPHRRGMRIAVAGGGPAGLEAARQAAELGARVVLYERDEQLGGQLRLAAAVRSRAPVIDLVEHLEHVARRLGVDVHLGVEATPDLIAGENVDAVIVATGARSIPPAYDRGDGAVVTTVWAALDGSAPVARERIVVVDDGSGFWDAVSAAEKLADEGSAVALVTPAGSVGAAIPFESIGPLLRRLADRRVVFHTLSEVTRVRRGCVHIRHVLTNEEDALEADLVAGHAGVIAEDSLVAPLEAAGLVVRTIGDCVAPRRLTQAMWDADRSVFELTREGPALRKGSRAW